MENVVADALIKVAPAIAMLLLALAARRSRDIGIVVLVAGLYLIDYVFLRISDWAPWTHPWETHWNWSGKIASVLLALAVLAIGPRVLADRIGLFRVPPVATWFPLLLVAGVYLGGRAYLLSTNGGQAFDEGSVLYQATMPGLDEELWFRGILWVLIATSLEPDRIEGGGVPWLTLLITTVWFGWVHAASADASSFTINWEAFIWPAASGLCFALLQGIGRAVWLPILTHNASNAMGWLGLFR